MDLVERLLARGERVRRASRPHLLGLVRQLGRRVAQLAVAVIVARMAQSGPVYALIELDFLSQLGVDVWLRPIPGWIAGLCTAAGAVILGLAAIDALRWRATRYYLTDQRVLQVYGVLVKLMIDVPLDRITDVAVQQSLLGAQLDYGDVLIRTAADERGRPMAAMIEPFAFRHAMEVRRQARVTPTLVEAPRPVERPRELAPDPSGMASIES